MTIYYGDFTLNGFLRMAGRWDLNAGDLIISYTLDLSSAPNIAYDWDWSKQGIVGIFNSEWSGARMVGNLVDWANRFEQFPIYVHRFKK